MFIKFLKTSGYVPVIGFELHSIVLSYRLSAPVSVASIWHKCLGIIVDFEKRYISLDEKCFTTLVRKCIVLIENSKRLVSSCFIYDWLLIVKEATKNFPGLTGHSYWFTSWYINAGLQIGDVFPQTFIFVHWVRFSFHYALLDSPHGILMLNCCAVVGFCFLSSGFKGISLLYEQVCVLLIEFICRFSILFRISPHLRKLQFDEIH